MSNNETLEREALGGRPDAGHETSTPAGLKRVVAAAMAGTVAEWYEFFLYGTASALVFGTHFFRQTGNPVDGVIAAFALYAVGFAARPIGGLVFGHFGDRIGRKALLQLSLVVVGITTFLMGCLPTFDVIGYWAPALLVTLRLIQGFAFGGEWGGAIILVSEHSPDNRRGFWASWPQAGCPDGQPGCHPRPPRAVEHPARRGLPFLGLARGVLVLRRGGLDRLLDPHQGRRRADLQGSAGPPGAPRRKPSRASCTSCATTGARC